MSVLIDKNKCIKCAGCVGVCPRLALSCKSETECDERLCTSCGICVTFCPAGAMTLSEK